MSPRAGLRDVDVLKVHDVVSLPLEEVVLLHSDDDVEITRRAAVLAGMSFAGKSNLGVWFDACRNGDGHFAGARFRADSATVGAWIGEDLPFASAGSACRYLRKVAKDALLPASHLACASALGASIGRGSGLGARAVTAAAHLTPTDIEFLFRSECSLLEFDGKLDLEVCALARSPRTLPCTATEESVEDVSEAPKVFEPIEAAAVGLDACMSKRVVVAALPGVAEHLIRFVDFLESLSRRRVLVAVGMVLHRQLAECPFDILIGRATGNPEHLIVVSLACGHDPRKSILVRLNVSL